MQGQRSTVESYPETFEFDLGSATNNSGMDQQVYWNNLVLNPIEAQDSPDYLLSSRDTDMPYMNSTSQSSRNLSIWNPGTSSPNENPINQGSCDETKIENGWTSLAIYGDGPRIEASRPEAINMLSSENIDINLNNNQMEIDQPLPRNSTCTYSPQNFDQNLGHVGTSSRVPESGLCPHPYAAGITGLEHVSLACDSTNAPGNSSRGAGFLSEEIEGRSGGSLDGRRLSCKRKNVEGVPEQSSASGSSTSTCFQQKVPEQSSASGSSTSTCFQQNENGPININLNISRSSDFLSGVSHSQLNPRIGTITAPVPSDTHTSVHMARNLESSQRNSRMRISPLPQLDTIPHNLWPTSNTVSPSNIWLTDQHSSLPISFSQPTIQQTSLPVPSSQSLQARPIVDGASSQTPFHGPVIPGLPRNVQPRVAPSNLRIGNSSTSPIILHDQLRTSRENTTLRRLSRNSTLDQMFISSNETRQPAQVPPNWGVGNRNTTTPGNLASALRAGTSSGVHQHVGSPLVSYQNTSAQYYRSRSLSEALQRSLFSTSTSGSADQSVNATSQRSVQAATSQDTACQSGTGRRVNAQAYVRSAALASRQRDGAPAVPVLGRNSAASREGRSRMFSEVSLQQFRNMVDLLQRGEQFRFEDVFPLDPSVLFAGGDLLDRHRDMRLDVDNMSYEELLALEERIGNVNTGLSEETVLKCLKQWKYSSVTIEASVEVEPCCVCQEEYVDNDEMGTLDCGHEYHTACIKQWLMQKNLCPICKTTALSKA